MQVNTHLFGTVEVAPEKIITFPAGLAGFENARRFALIYDTENSEQASYTLQSLDQATVAFQIIDATAVGINYEISLSDAESAALQTPAAEDVAVMLMLFKQEPGTQGVAANVRAPLLINTRALVGIQKIVDHPRTNLVISNLSSAV
jgi:flagellar assembly factor FliW